MTPYNEYLRWTAEEEQIVDCGRLKCSHGAKHGAQVVVLKKNKKNPKHYFKGCSKILLQVPSFSAKDVGFSAPAAQRGKERNDKRVESENS